MPVRIDGLPAHVLLVHAIVVLLPLAALMMVVGALWPAARARLGVATPVLALVVLALVPVTTHAGHWLEHHLGYTTPQIRRHASLGGELLPFAAAMFVVAALGWVLHRRYDLGWRPSGARPRLPVWANVLVAALTVAVAVAGVVQVYRIGESGARAVWGGVGSH